MKLPKKYQGVTPGEWEVDLPYLAEIVSQDGTKIGSTWAEKHRGDTILIDRQCATNEQYHHNAEIMADSPRLAAAVVELREALKIWHDGHEVLPIPCVECGEDSTKKITFLYENARNNPASSGYRGDDISWCADAEENACDEHADKVRRNPPDNMKWCSEFDGKRFPHTLVKRQSITGERLKALMEKTAAALASTEEFAT